MESQVYELLHRRKLRFLESLMSAIVCDTYKTETYQVIASLMWYELETAIFVWDKEKLETEALESIKKLLDLLEYLIKKEAK